MISQEAMRAEWEAANQRTQEVQAETPQPEVETAEVEQPTLPEIEKPVEETSNPVETPTDNTRVENPNWRRMREQNKELERKVAEMESYLKQSQKPPEPVEEDYEPNDDDITEGRHYKALKKQVRSLNEAIVKERQERDKLIVESRLRANYPDIFKVVTKDNLEALGEAEPELVQSITTSSDMYAQYAAAYKLIKKLGVGSQDPHLEDKARAQKNMAKPKSAATVAPRLGESPLAEAERFANGLTSDLQAQLLKEMEEAISNR
jgi:hypothetical protein